MHLFDAYIMVDWSARAVPKNGRDSIWIAQGARKAAGLEMGAPENPRTRLEAYARLGSLLHDWSFKKRRVLIGFDFALGYPAGTAAALLNGESDGAPSWRATWALLAASVEDGARNQNNRFAAAAELNRRMGGRAGPFWGTPPSCAAETLHRTKPAFPYAANGTQLAEFRIAERRLKGRGVHPHAVWQLLGAGSVGSQTLMGLPYVLKLRNDPVLAPHTRVWPFETGFDAGDVEQRPFILMTEVWPNLVDLGSLHEVRDADQMLSLVRQLAQWDEQGELGTRLAHPKGLTQTERKVCEDEEGWILGA